MRGGVSGRIFAERLMASEVDVLCNAGYGAAGRAVTSSEHEIGRVYRVSHWACREDSTGCTFVARQVIGGAACM